MFRAINARAGKLRVRAGFGEPRRQNADHRGNVIIIASPLLKLNAAGGLQRKYIVPPNALFQSGKMLTSGLSG
jgi:hypothetical protein